MYLFIIYTQADMLTPGNILQSGSVVVPTIIKMTISLPWQPPKNKEITNFVDYVQQHP